MPDMLVNLLRLPPHDASLDELRRAGVVVRRAQPWELTPVREFVPRNFNEAWADEISVGFARQPGPGFGALPGRPPRAGRAYECPPKNCFRHTAVAGEQRGR